MTDQIEKTPAKKTKMLTITLALLLFSCVSYFLFRYTKTPVYIGQKTIESFTPDNGEDTLRGSTTQKLLTTASSTFYEMSYYIPNENEKAADLFTEKANLWLADTNVNDVKTSEQAKSLGITKNGCSGYSYQADYKKYRSNRLVSFVSDIYEYTCGAHPSSYFVVYNENTETGKTINTLSDIYSPNIYSYLSSISKSKLPSQLKTEKEIDVSDIKDMFEDGTSDKQENFKTFYFDGSDLILIFGQYSIGPYAIGSTELRVPLSSLAAYKK